MMLTPQNLANTQKVRSKIEHLLRTLHQKGYKLYLVGNWAHINSLKNHFPEIFNYFSGTIMSGDIHLLKPYQEYYDNVLKKTHTHANQALWIETESRFISRARYYGYNVIFFNNDYNSLLSDLRNFGVNV